MTHLNALNTLKDWATYYHSLGYQVVPCKGKIPTVKWREIKETSLAQIEDWWTQYPDANIGILTGRVSGLAVLDIDGEKGQNSARELDLKTDETPVVKTGSGNGYHFYYKHPGYEVRNFAGEMAGVDFRGDGGLVIAPPSNHASGNKYQWLVQPDTPLADPPEWLLALIKEKPDTAPRDIPNSIPAGERNNTLLSIAGTMRRRGIGYDPIYAALSVINENRCNPKLSNSEVRKIAQSVTKYRAEDDLFDETAKLTHITEVENPAYLNRKVTVDAIVAGTFRGYGVPSSVQCTWYDQDEIKTEAIRNIEPNDPVNMALTGATANFKQRLLSSQFPESQGKVRIRDLEYRTVYSGRIRPPVHSLELQGDKIVDELGFEYKDYIVYISTNEQITFQPSSLMTLTGYVLPDPKTQKITLLVTSVEFPETIDNFDQNTLDQIKLFYADKTVSQRVDWVLDEFEKYGKIIGRKNVAAATMLGFFTSTWIVLDREIQRGWCNNLIVGDSTTGKSQTVRNFIRLVKAGTWITAETASSVGLVGAATQMDRSGWSVDWGFLVLNDGRLLAIDGAQKLSKTHWAALAESERSGIVTIAKAAKDTAYARTRQIKIANPIDQEAKRSETKTLSEFFYPIQAASTFLDLQNVARIDLCVFAGSDDIDVARINKQFTDDADPRLGYLGDALKWVWGNNVELEFTQQALDTLLSQSTLLYNKFFHKLVPLVSIDVKWKIARLAAALAAITLSTDDYSVITVTEEHVNWVAGFIDEEYSNNGLDQLVKHSSEDEITDEIVEDTLIRVGKKLGAASDPDIDKAYEVIEYIAVHGNFTKDNLKERFELARDNQLRPLIAALNDLGLVKQSRGYNSTAYLNKLTRYILQRGGLDSFSAFSAFRSVKRETPKENSQRRPD